MKATSSVASMSLRPPLLAFLSRHGRRWGSNGPCRRALQLCHQMRQRGLQHMCSPTALSQRMQQGYPSGRGVGGPWRPVLTTGQHAGRLLGGSGKAPQDAKFMTQEASVSHGTDWPYLALSVPGDKLHKWVSVSCDRLAYSTCAVSWSKVGFSVMDRLPTYLSSWPWRAALRAQCSYFTMAVLGDPS